MHVYSYGADDHVHDRYEYSRDMVGCVCRVYAACDVF